MTSQTPERHEPASVVAVPPRLLVGVDGRQGGRRALEVAAVLARQFGARVVVGHVQPLPQALAPGEFEQALREDLELEVLTQAAAALDPQGVPWTLALAEGDPAHGLHHLAELHGAALVVIGTRGCGAGPALRRIVNGSVSTHLVHHESCPVLVVPAPKVDLARPGPAPSEPDR